MPPKVKGATSSGAPLSAVSGKRARKQIIAFDEGFKLVSDEGSVTLLDLDHDTPRYKPVETGLSVIRDAADFIAVRGKTQYVLPRAEWTALVADFKRYCQYGTGKHGEWLSDPDWRKLYQAKPRKMLIVDKTTDRLEGKARDTVPCHYCGLVLPVETIIQMDHHHPQADAKSGGATGGTRAVAKVLRAFNAGFVMAGPDGDKGRNFRSPTPIYPEASDFDPAKGMRRPKYKLTEKGQLALSMLASVYGIGRVEVRCLNSFINMVPLCASCNGASKKGAALRAIA